MHFARMRRAAMLMVAIFGYTAVSLAQQTVTGTVTDKKGDPLPGVTVSVKGSKVATSTNNNGVYTLNNVAADAVLKFSGAGITGKEITVSGKSPVNAELETSVGNMNEVVVVGYGTRKIKDLTGSVASISEKDFNKGVIATPEQLLQGRTAGVTVLPASGEPGAGISINIRGSSSIRASNNPLFVVDGVPLDGGGTSGGLDFGAGSSSARNPLAFLNPNDIENMTILKDASAAAIYGSRGANGVVLITTKKGRSKQGLQFGVSTSASKAASKYDLLSAEDFVVGIKGIGGNVDAVDKGAITNWQDQIFQTGIAQNYNLSQGGVIGKTVYRISGGYNVQEGIIRNSKLERLTGRINLSQKFLKDKIKVDVSLTGSNIKNQYAPISDNAGYQGSLVGAAIRFNPTYPIFNADGSYYDPQDGNRNPSAMLAYLDDRDNVNKYLGNISASYEFVKGLTYKATFGFENSSSLRKSFADPRLKAYNGKFGLRGLDVSNEVSTGGNVNGRGVHQTNDLSSTLVEHTLTYDAKLGNKSELNVIGGYAYQKFTSEVNNDFRWGVRTPGVLIKDINAFTQKFPIFGDTSQSELQSYFGRVNYSYDNRYYITGTVRVDGSSKFGSGNKYGTFPAAAFKWKIMNEAFVGSGFKNFFNDLSLRINYGITGNQEFPPNASQAIAQRQFNGGRNPLQAANPNLKWEQTTTTGIGLDFAFFKGRLKGTVDYFNRSTENLIFLAEYAQPAAVNFRWLNLPGKVINNGLELGLDLQVIRPNNGSFAWDVSYNMTFLKNTVKDFGQNVVNTGAISGNGLSGAYAQTIKNGFPLFSFNVPKFLRFDGNGLALYADGGNNQLLGSALPTFTAGLTNNFTFHNWNASLFMNAVTGFYVYNNTANALFLAGTYKTGTNVTYSVLNSPENPLNSGSVSSRFLEKGDFLRLSNASIGYTFLMKNKSFVKTLNVSASGQNLFLLTNYSGLDPEVNTNKELNGVPSRGIDYTAFPMARTVTIGVNIGF